jgi:hypothetical protein
VSGFTLRTLCALVLLVGGLHRRAVRCLVMAGRGSLRAYAARSGAPKFPGHATLVFRNAAEDVVATATTGAACRMCGVSAVDGSPTCWVWAPYGPVAIPARADSRVEVGRTVVGEFRIEDDTEPGGTLPVGSGVGEPGLGGLPLRVRHAGVQRVEARPSSRRPDPERIRGSLQRTRRSQWRLRACSPPIEGQSYSVGVAADDCRGA